MDELKITFCEYTEDFLEPSWNWLHDPEIAKLTATPPFSKESQRTWFDSLKERTDYSIWGILCEGQKIGAAGFKSAINKEAEYFAYLGNRDYWDRGLSRQILECITEQAKEAGIQRLWGRIKVFNTRSVRAHEKLGFVTYKKENEFVFVRIAL